MYLNPEVVVANGLSNIWATQAWAVNNQSSLSNYFYDLNGIPNQFDANVFVSGSGSTFMNLSPLNKIIYQAMLVEGMTSNDILIRASYPSTIMKSVVYLGNGVFDGFTGVGSNVIGIGDVVRLRGSTSAIAQVMSLGGSQIGLSNIRNTRFGGVGSKYVVVGIEVYDVQRIGSINYWRLYAPASSNPPVINYYQDTKFNPDLYRLLYNDSRNLTDRDAYLQYVALASNNIRRIAKADDITACNQITTQLQNVSVAQELNINTPSGSLRFKNAVVYGISQDDLSTSILLFPSQAYPKLITEYAVKTYIDRPYLTTAVFSNADFNGTVVFYGSVRFPGRVVYNDLECSNLKINSASCNMGIGYHYGCNWFYAPSNYFTSNVIVGGTVATSTLLVSSNVLVGGTLQTCNLVAPTATISNVKTTNLLADNAVFDSLLNMGSGYHYGSNWFYSASFSNAFVEGTLIPNTLVVNSNSTIKGLLQVQNDIITPCNLAVGNTITSSNATFCNLSTTTLSATTSSILDGVVYLRKIAIM